VDRLQGLNIGGEGARRKRRRKRRRSYLPFFFFFPQLQVVVVHGVIFQHNSHTPTSGPLLLLPLASSLHDFSSFRFFAMATRSRTLLFLQFRNSYAGSHTSTLRQQYNVQQQQSTLLTSTDFNERAGLMEETTIELMTLPPKW
jgi:hypothetical protein